MLNKYESTSTNRTPWPLEVTSSGACKIFVFSPSISVTPEAKVAPINHQDQLISLKDDIGFNISEIAALLKATRPSIYNWLQGSLPSQKTQDRLDVIYSALDVWKDFKLGQINHLSRRKFDNETLFSLLCEENLSLTKINSILLAIKTSIEDANARKRQRETMLAQGAIEPLNTNEALKNIDKITKKIG